MTRAELQALPPTISLWPTAAGAIGVGRTTAYKLVRTGRWPTRILWLGSLIRIPTADLLEVLGITPDDTRAQREPSD